MLDHVYGLITRLIPGYIQNGTLLHLLAVLLALSVHLV
jgi:hypothetical protein